MRYGRTVDGMNRRYSNGVLDVVGRWAAEIGGLSLLIITAGCFLALATWTVDDRSFTHATTAPVRNALGFPGAALADLLIQILGFGVIVMLIPVACWGWRLLTKRGLDQEKTRVAAWIAGIAASATMVSCLPVPASWPLPGGLGGIVGDALRNALAAPLAPRLGIAFDAGLASIMALAAGFSLLHASAVIAPAIDDVEDMDDGDDSHNTGFSPLGLMTHWFLSAKAFVARRLDQRQSTSQRSEIDTAPQHRREPALFGASAPPDAIEVEGLDIQAPFPESPATRVAANKRSLKPGRRAAKEAQPDLLAGNEYELPPLALLAEPKRHMAAAPSEESLEGNARILEGVLDDFGVRGEVMQVRPGPVVTLYELQPAPGIKSSRVVGLADDIARSMSAISARVAVIPGRNAIGIELPNARRETVYLRELMASRDFEDNKSRLALCLGKTIGGEPVIVDLAKMPHLLIAGTTGSGKSVGINTMILSLLYRLRPDQCRLIMVDPKMLELSVYDGIPHLLAPVVTDPKKAVVALKWAVREMEERYRKMSKLGVRNIDGYNARVEEARVSGETITRTVQTGFDADNGQPTFEEQTFDLEALPYIVVVVDEMADLMLVAGKDIEGAIQRLAQMARAAGIHLIMATQRPSVDVITGTIKANFPTRVSFQVTSKIDSRTILGEQGAEQLLGQGDMLYMAGGGRISRVHGPFVSDGEVESIVTHLKSQGQPSYLDAVTREDELVQEEADSAVFDKGAFGESESADPYDQAIAIVLRDGKASTSYIQRRLQIGYNRAASLMERMEKEGIVSPANHTGKREILIERPKNTPMDDE